MRIQSHRSTDKSALCQYKGTYVSDGYTHGFHNPVYGSNKPVRGSNNHAHGSDKRADGIDTVSHGSYKHASVSYNWAYAHDFNTDSHVPHEITHGTNDCN
jgi:hypothetical protein